jgi:hypothetical protein
MIRSVEFSMIWRSEDVKEGHTEGWGYKGKFFVWVLESRVQFIGVK